MWPIQLFFLLFSVCKIFFSPSAPSNTSFLIRSVQAIFLQQLLFKCCLTIASAVLSLYGVWMNEYGGLVEWLYEENLSTRRKTHPSAIFYNINPTWTGVGSSPDLYGERPATNRQLDWNFYEIFWCTECSVCDV
jgi:hypothetical protein